MLTLILSKELFKERYNIKDQLKCDVYYMGFNYEDIKLTSIIAMLGMGSEEWSLE